MYIELPSSDISESVSMFFMAALHNPGEYAGLNGFKARSFPFARVVFFYFSPLKGKRITSYRSIGYASNCFVKFRL